MNEHAFVLIEDIQLGCRVAIDIVGVTLDQQYAYDWSLEPTDEFKTRRVEIAQFLP